MQGNWLLISWNLTGITEKSKIASNTDFILYSWEKREYWTLNLTATQSFITTLSYLLTHKLWVFLLNFVWLSSSRSVQNFIPIIFVIQRCNFVYSNKEFI